MYESFYGLKEKPFTLLPDPEYLYLSPKHQRALTLLEYGMMNQAGFSVICGDTGAGKTTLIRRLLSELGDDTSVGLITNTHQSFGELLNWVLMAFGLEGEGKSKAQMHHIFIDFLIDQYAQNKHAVLIVDEAQNMSADTLEELRMLSNINADKDQILQVILAGQPALRETLRKPELMQFAQRIAVDYYLEALSAEETSAYIQHRLKVAGAERQIFTDDACSAIYKYSGGTPRLINLLCDTALVYGFAEQSENISVQLVHDVVREQHSNSIIPTFNTTQPHKVDDLPLAEKTVELEQINKVAEEIAESYVVKNIEAELAQKEELIRAASKAQVRETKSVENDEIIADLAQRAVQAVSSADKASAVIHSQNASSVSQSAQSQSVQIEELTGKAESSNVTSINVKQPEFNTETSEEITLDYELEAEEKNQKIIEEKAEVKVEDEIAEKDENEQQNVEALMASVNQKDSDVYPVVQLEESPRRGVSMVIAGVVTGMFIASLSMVAIAWMFLNSNGTNLLQSGQNQLATERQNEQLISNRRELEIIQQERDAALAVSRALERERDAALSAAKVQEQMREIEQRAAEILAEQESKAEKKLRQAQARAREAERAEAKALKRERALKLKAEEAKLAILEAKRLQLIKEARRHEKEVARQEIKGKQLAQVKTVEVENVVVKSGIIKNQVKAEKGASKAFSANPCNSPSAKFLSTCKK